MEEIKKEIFKQNALYKEALKLQEKVKPILKEFENKPITKKDNTLLKSVKDKLKPLECFKKEVEHYNKGNKATLQIYFLSSEFDVYANVQFCYIDSPDKNGVCGCRYYEEYIYFGEIQSHVLKGFYEHKYNLLDEEEQLNQFVKTQGLINQVIDEKEKLHYKLKEFLSERIKKEQGFYK